MRERFFLVCQALWWWLSGGHRLNTTLLPLHEKIDAQRWSWAVAIRALSVNCCGIGHGERTPDILPWLMTGDTYKICDLWRSCPCWSITWSGISCGPIHAESCRNGHCCDSSLSHRSCGWELPWTAAHSGTFFIGRLPPNNQCVLKCSAAW